MCNYDVIIIDLTDMNSNFGETALTSYNIEHSLGN